MANGEFDPQKIEEFLKRIRESKSSWAIGGAIFGAVFLIAMIASSVYTVQPEEVAVIQRFGKYLDTMQPGLHFKLPLGIDKKTIVRPRFSYKEEFTINAAPSRSRGRQTFQPSRTGEFSLMLTGDLNIASVEWSVQYQIQDPRSFLFNIRNPVSTLRDAAEAAMRLVVGDRSVDEVLTVGREDVNRESQEKLQILMDSYKTGIQIVAVVLQSVTPPDPVKDSFDNVNKAKQQKETMVNEAREAYNKVIPRARGEAEKVVSTSEGYATKRVNEAKGDAQRFIEVHRAYAASPSVIRKRLYIEKMADIFSRLDNIWVVDDKLKNVIPLLQTMKIEDLTGADQ